MPLRPAQESDLDTVIELVHALGADMALGWRLATRNAFLHYLGRGYRVARFDRGDGPALPAYELEYTPTIDG